MAFFVLVALPLVGVLQISDSFLFLAVGALFSLVPDIDQSNSKLGRYVKPVGFVMKHRGILHSVWIPLSFAALVFPYSYDIAVALFLGYTSHLVSDSLTKEGIAFFYPLSHKAKGFIRTGGFSEKLFFTIIIIGLLYIVN
jgi:inner membrane protein